MKKILSSIFALAAIFALSACSNQDEPAAPVKSQQLKVSITVNKGSDSSTRAIKEDWKNGDLIYVVFDHKVDQDTKYGISKYDGLQYMTLTYTNGYWVESFSIPNLQDSLISRKSGYMNAVYVSNPDKSDKPYIEEKGYVFPMDNGYALFTEDKTSTYTIKDNELTGSLTLKNEVYDIFETEPYTSGFAQILINGLKIEDGYEYTLRITDNKHDFYTYVPGAFFTLKNDGQFYQGWHGAMDVLEPTECNADGTYFHAFLKPVRNADPFYDLSGTMFNLYIVDSEKESFQEYRYFKANAYINVNDAIILPNLDGWYEVLPEE